jgi:hypothetical protein
MSSKTTLISSLPPKALTCRASVAPSTLPLFSTRWTDGCLITCASAAFSWVRSISWRISAKVRYVTEPAFAKHSRNCAMRCLRRSAIDLVRPLAERRSRDEGSEAYFRPIGDFSGEMAVAQVDAGFTPRIIGRIDLRTHARGHRVQSAQKGIHRSDHQSSTVFPSASRLFRQNRPRALQSCRSTKDILPAKVTSEVRAAGTLMYATLSCLTFKPSKTHSRSSRRNGATRRYARAQSPAP